MKLSVLFALALAFPVMARAAAPSDDQMSKIGEQSRKFGFMAYSQIACLNSNGQLVAAGAYAWPTRLEIYLVDHAGVATPTKRVSLDETENNLQFTVNGDTGSLVLDPNISVDGALQVQKGTLTLGAGESAQLLTCYERPSALE